MSRKPPRKPDRRVLRTRETLGDALVDLMHEKPYDDITVREVLARAEVGRSTFYAHYRGKDDLFLSDVDEFFAALASRVERSGERSRRVAPGARVLRPRGRGARELVWSRSA